MNLLFYDTETSDMPDFKAPSASDHQPHIVQLAASLVDSATFETIAAIDLVVKPDGWAITPETTAIHGITMERAGAVGVPEFLVVRTLLSLWKAADIRIGHVETFDARILRIALKRFVSDSIADAWKAGRAECTAKLAAAHLGWKKRGSIPLRDAHQQILGCELQRAHTARGDVDGTMAIYREITGGSTDGD